jgi:arginyl-tRNA synthetase
MICHCQPIKKYSASSYVDEYGSIHIILNRKIFIEDIFEMVIQQGVNYGQKQKPIEGYVLINCNSVDGELNLGQLRNILLSNHTAQVLKQNGWVF